MADYNETTVTGTAWQRAWQITMANTLGGPPLVRYDEEVVINMDEGKQIRQPFQGMPINYQVDPLAVIELRDPETLELTGDSIPVALVHQALFSDYVNRAKARDDAANAPVEPAPEPAPEEPTE